MRGPFAILAVLCTLSGAQAQERLTVVAQRVTGNAPLFLAIAKNYFKSEGLDVELKFVAAAQQGASMLANGQADVAAIELSAPVLNFAGRGTIKAIAGQAREKQGYDGASLLASNAAAAGGFKEMQNLRERSLAITQLGSVYHYEAGAIARAKGFDLSTVTLKPMQTLDAVAAALASGQADAAIMPADYARALIAANQAKTIGLVSSAGEPQSGAIFASARAIESTRAAIEKFVRAYQRGCAEYEATLLRRNRFYKLIIDDRAHEAAVAVAGYIYPQASPQQGALQIEGMAPYADAQARLDVADFLTLFAWFRAQGLIDSSAEPRKALDLSFLKSHLNAAQ